MLSVRWLLNMPLSPFHRLEDGEIGRVVLPDAISGTRWKHGPVFLVQRPAVHVFSTVAKHSSQGALVRMDEL